MSFKLYSALGLSKGASKDDIKKAFRRLAVQHHPDKGGDPEKFKEIAHAYEVLSDDNKKTEYDRVGDDGYEAMHQGGHPGFDMDPRHIFEQFFSGGGMFGGDPFGRGDARVRRGDQTHVLRVPMHEAYTGCQKHIKICVQKTCFKCKETCSACQGRGSITDMRRMGFFTQMMTRPCDNCSGTGMMSRGREDCKECQGKAMFQEEKRIDIVVPAGIQSGHQIRLERLGEQAKSEGEIPGDLILQFVVLEDPNFVRRGDDLVYTAHVTLSESIVGKTITIPHFAEPIVVATESYGIVQPNRHYTMDGKGMPIINTKTYGKLHLQFIINYPDKKFSVEERDRLLTCFKELGI